MRTRNPVAGNAHRYNRASVFRANKGKGSYVRNNRIEVEDEDEEYESDEWDDFSDNVEF